MTQQKREQIKLSLSRILNEKCGEFADKSSVYMDIEAYFNEHLPDVSISEFAYRLEESMADIIEDMLVNNSFLK